MNRSTIMNILTRQIKAQRISLLKRESSLHLGEVLDLLFHVAG